MSQPFLGEIRMFGFNFAPRGWAACSGQLLSISQNTALFSLLGTFYGGNGQTTFALPNLNDNGAINQGQGNGLSDRFIGEPGGIPVVTLNSTEVPPHTHVAQCNASDGGGENGPGGNTWGEAAGGQRMYLPGNPPAGLTQMAFQAIAPTGSGLPHNNMMPFVVVNFCIAQQGIFPARQ
jgi:microcystin-dependent protein